ncbi:MAG: transcription antitermination factor NusB [Verrucomicrobia bacterium]|nr:transcription antitermination factor NusB [Verrucomicrobiota bacterium]
MSFAERRDRAVHFLDHADLDAADRSADARALAAQGQPAGFAEELIQGVIRDLTLIDEVIGKYAKNWAFGRIARVDLAILRIAIFELMRRTDIPPVVSINEAVDIAKEFSTEESKRFVNGILDSYKEELGRDPRKAEGG